MGKKGEIVNIAGYRFIHLKDRDELRQPFREITSKLGIKGTILLSHNGINFFLAGTKASIDNYISYLDRDERFKNMSLHISYSDYQPFRRMLVRLKKEIISLGIDEVRPADYTGKYIEPMEFKKWLENTLDKIEKNEDIEYKQTNYWKLIKYSCVRITRNPEWFRKRFPDFEKFWEKVLYHRKNGAECLLPKKRTLKQKEPILLINTDTDDDSD